jgi:hypothetical protein
MNLFLIRVFDFDDLGILFKVEATTGDKGSQISPNFSCNGEGRAFGGKKVAECLGVLNSPVGRQRENPLIIMDAMQQLKS